jgi:hypothetical protein
MSFALDIHLWPSSDVESDIDLYRIALDCVPTPGISSDLGVVPAKFRRMLIESGTREIIDEKLNSNEPDDFFEVIKVHQNEDTHTLVESLYQYWDYDDASDMLVKVERPLDLNLYGSKYVQQGYYYKRYGPIRIAFYNVQSFRIPQSLINAIRKAQALRKDATKWLRMIAQLSQNYSIVKDYVRAIIVRNVLDHLVICTESEVHPLTAHGIYHRYPQDFFKDLYKIAKLHEYGGLYFCDVSSNDPAFIAARKSTLDYGYLRGDFGNRSNKLFAEKTQRMVNVIMQTADKVQPTREQLEECFTLMADTDIEDINGGFLLNVKEAPFDYLEEPYFIFYDRLL